MDAQRESSMYSPDVRVFSQDSATGQPTVNLLIVARSFTIRRLIMEIQHVMYILMVQDMDRMVDFYTGVIGFRQRSVSSNWSELAFGAFTLALHHGGTSYANNTRLAFTVTDIDTACKEVLAAGGNIIKSPYDGNIPGLIQAVVSDAEGNSLEFGQYRT